MKLRDLIYKIRILLFGKSYDVYYINGAETLPPPLSKEDEQKAFELLKNGNNKGRELLIIHNLRLVVYIAKKFESTGIGIEDLVSIGTIGLIKAVKTFCPDKNIKLATYASRCIENEILMYLRKTTQHKNDISIDEPLNFDSEGNELLLSDILGTDTDLVVRGIENEVEISLLLNEVSKLNPRERQIMEMRFGLGEYKRELTQKQVADIVGISQSYISRLEKRIIKKLRENLEKIC
ncbi:MAG: RNA polymerase sporulation sigma factor SigE [Ruminococcus sp.]|nr:RNA polymerase sporulation sigma factor SigE [Ruminococcus sp.]MBQ8379106.1 RNA polymerase sporulation sigma factor SigE [Oscillospiraceae bacterium]